MRSLAARYAVRPTKQRGQNFVIDANTVRRIVRAARLEPTDVVLEVGSGLGSLTLGLLDACAHVTALEIDAHLAQALPSTVEEYAPGWGDHLSVIEADAMRVDADAVASAAGGRSPTALVANLPYNVAVPVLLHLLATQPDIQRGLVMVQLEVADRLAAAPGSKAYGVPSVKAAWYAEVQRAGLVGRSVFWPAPRVDSGLVSFQRRPTPATSAGRRAVFDVVEAAFGQRRKMLRSALAGLAGSPTAAAAALARADVDPTARGERLALDDFVRVADALAQAS